jgi:two-component system OmpR family response regulator
MRVLVVEDDKDVAHYIVKGLNEAGHTTDHASEGKQGLFLATTEHYDVMILDRMLPNVDGTTIINTMRACDIQIPVLFLSAKNKVEDRVTGLRSGADDYLTKPFAFEELLARIELLALRKQPLAQQSTTLESADLCVDLLARTVKRGDDNIELQAREFRLLEYLLRNKGRVVTRTMLLENVWDYNFDPQTNLIDVHISRLRQKIDKDFSTPLIETVRGAGYRLLDV